MQTPLYGRLVLADGTALDGGGAGGQQGCVTGELVFQTAMVGYQEALTDPSYAGQILLFTYPLIGNYGTGPTGAESGQVHARAAVVHELHDSAGHYAMPDHLHVFLAAQGVPVVTGLDTRALVRRIRTAGVMPAAVAVAERVAALPPVAELLAAARAADYASGDYVAATTCAAPTWLPPTRDGAPTVALLDYGAKGSIAERLRAHGAGVWVLPAHSSAAAIRTLRPDGVLLSNGPGDPARLGPAIAVIRELLAAGVPMMGICLGHQLLAHALGGTTFKMAYGHRGINQPVLEIATRRVLLTTQNHGYAVRADSLPPEVAITYTNLNDGTVEGLAHRTRPVFGVQWHPEAHPGPADSDALFASFLARLPHEVVHAA